MKNSPDFSCFRDLRRALNSSRFTGPAPSVEQTVCKKRAMRLTRGREVSVFPSYISLTVMLWGRHNCLWDRKGNRLDVTCQTDKSPSHLILSDALSHFLPLLCCGYYSIRRRQGNGYGYGMAMLAMDGECFALHSPEYVKCDVGLLPRACAVHSHAIFTTAACLWS